LPEALKRIAAELAAQTGKLDLSGLQIIELPPEMQDLASLKKLDCSRTQVRDLELLRGHTGLQILNCHSTQVSELEPLRCLNRLRKLDISASKVSDLEPLLSLTSLQNLNCTHTQVNNLEPLRGLTSLQTLSCISTKVSNLETLQNLTSLQNLRCSFTKVRELKPLRNLTSLRELDCSGTKVSDLEPLQRLISLQILICSHTQVSDLEPLRALTNLREIDCSYTKVRDLKPLREHSSLQFLNCHCTQIRELEPLRLLTNLISLDCSHTQVSESDLEPLQGIATFLRLQCSATKVSKLEPLRSFANLQILDCSSTQVGDLEPIVDLQTLHTLYIRNLKINEFPRKLLFSENLKRLHLIGANIQGIPKEALSNDELIFNNYLPALRAHVLDLEVEAIPINSVKILVLGNGGVGKTQLCRHLAAEPFDPTVLTTHGIALRTIAPASEGDATQYLWDFGGQDIYHSAHTLFMRTAAVFVVLWTPEQEAMVASDNDDDPLERLHPLTYWLEYVRTLGRPDSPVLVVQSQCDTPAQAAPVPPVDGGLLESFGCLSVCNFSAHTPRGAASLREALADANAYLRDRDGISSIGRGRHLVWQQLETWRQADQQLPAPQRLHRTLSQAEFARLCEQIGGVSSPEALLRFLHNKGVVFHSPDLFHNRILLDQSWALDAVYAVFERGSTYPLIKANDGRLWPSLLAATVWREYEPEAQKLFLSLMGTCGIVFPYREADADLGLEAEYLAPDLLPSRSSPQVSRQLRGRWEGSDPSLTLIYTYSFLHGGLVRALLCDLGNHAGDGGVYWRYGAWVYDARHGCIALLDQQMVDDRAGTITISFQGAGSVKLADWFIKRLAERNRQFGYADLQPSCSGPLASQVLALDKRQRLDSSDISEASAPPPPKLVPAPVEAFHKPGREVFISYGHLEK
jgi:internalin A